jgi:hypothetical protein
MSAQAQAKPFKNEGDEALFCQNTRYIGRVSRYHCGPFVETFGAHLQNPLTETEDSDFDNAVACGLVETSMTASWL